MKSEEEKRLDKASDEYFELFGENYPLFFTDMRKTEDIIADIEECVKTKKKKEEPEINREYDY